MYFFLSLPTVNHFRVVFAVHDKNPMEQSLNTEDS